MLKIIIGVVLTLFSFSTLAGEVGSYPNASTLTGTERMLSDQSTVTVDITPAQLKTFAIGSITGAVVGTTDIQTLTNNPLMRVN